MERDCELSSSNTENDQEEFQQVLENFLEQIDIFLLKVRQEIEKSEAVIRAKYYDL